MGADAFGDSLLGLLDERGVDRSLVVRAPDAQTSATVVLVDGAGERTFLHVPGANGLVRARRARPRARARHPRAPHRRGARAARRSTASRRRSCSTRRAAAVSDVARHGVGRDGRWDRLFPSLPHLDLSVSASPRPRALSGEASPSVRRRGRAGAAFGTVAVKLGADGLLRRRRRLRAGACPRRACDAVDRPGRATRSRRGCSTPACTAGRSNGQPASPTPSARSRPPRSARPRGCPRSRRRSRGRRA